jgi:hypothetical protein
MYWLVFLLGAAPGRNTIDASDVVDRWAAGGTHTRILGVGWGVTTQCWTGGA